MMRKSDNRGNGKAMSEAIKTMEKRVKRESRRRMLAMIAVVILTIGTLTGCQLAKESTGDEQAGDEQRDSLVGIMVTTEWLDLFDNEAWLQDNLDKIVAGGELTGSASDYEKYSGRLYASVVERPLYDENGNEASSTKEFVFEGVNGHMFYAAGIYGEDGEVLYITSGSDSGVSLSKNHLTFNDTGMVVELEGTIYVVPQAQEEIAIYHMYPLYQEPDGDMYLVDGNSVSFNNETDGEGMSMSYTYDEAVKVTDTEGNVSENKASVKVTIEVVLRPERVVVTQMDARSQIVSREEYPAGEVPGELVPEADTEYIIVEMFKQGTENQSVDRQLYDKEESGFYTLYAREDGFCEQVYTSIQWR